MHSYVPVIDPRKPIEQCSKKTKTLDLNLVNQLRIVFAQLSRCFRDHSFSCRGDILVVMYFRGEDVMWGSVLSRRFRGACLLRLFRESLSRAFAPSYFLFTETPWVNSLIKGIFERCSIALAPWNNKCYLVKRCVSEKKLHARAFMEMEIHRPFTRIKERRATTPDTSRAFGNQTNQTKSAETCIPAARRDLCRCWCCLLSNMLLNAFDFCLSVAYYNILIRDYYSCMCLFFWHGARGNQL
jgi:hypothetical protein